MSLAGSTSIFLVSIDYLCTFDFPPPADGFNVAKCVANNFFQLHKSHINNMLRIGIDLGGTKIELLALDESGERYRERIATPQESYAKTLDAIVALVNTAETALGETGTVGIATPGAISRARNPRLRRALRDLSIEGRSIA